MANPWISWQETLVVAPGSLIYWKEAYGQDAGNTCCSKWSRSRTMCSIIRKIEQIEENFNIWHQCLLKNNILVSSVLLQNKVLKIYSLARKYGN